MIEATLYALLAALLATRRPLRDLWRQLDGGHRAFLAAFFALLVAGQLADDGIESFLGGTILHWRCATRSGTRSDRWSSTTLGWRAMM